jgi:hypothetical protein
VRRGTRLGHYASINPDGRIAINHLLWEEMGSPKTVSLLYDEDNMCVGIRPVSSIMPNSFPVIPITPDGKRFWIRARDFVRLAGIEISYCVRFLDPHIEDDVLVLDLKLTTRVLGRGKSNKR